MFKLVIEDDEGNKTVVPIIRDEITIGRKDGHTIRLTERNVSRDHAKLVRKDGEVFFEEMSARYGSKKNGQRIDGRTEFTVGDVVSIGDYRLTLQSDVAPEAKPPKKPNGAAAKEKNFSNQPTQITKIDTTTDREGTEIIAADPAKLVIVSSNFAGQEFPLARREMVIGRGEECDIIIDHRSVSQKHAKVVREPDGEYKIVDLKSKNGVKVGGEDYRAVHLKRGDIVDLGHVKFRFVEAGENYVFAPHVDDEGGTGRSKSSKGLVIAGGLMVCLVSIVVGFMVLGGGQSGDSEALARVAPTTGVAEPPAQTVPADVPVEQAGAALDQKIDKAEQDYRAGMVQKSAGMLELLREEKEITPEQVERIDRLLSMTKRERGFVRYFENGRDHFEAGRWLEALAEFRQIPDDPELNIYQLVRDGGFIDKAVANATDEQLARAKGDDGGEREDAHEKLTELAALYPGHVAPAEALAEVSAAKPVKVAAATAKERPKQKVKEKEPAVAAVVEVKPSAPTKTEADPELAKELYGQAMKSFVRGDYNGAISLADEARENGCTKDCFRVIGMSHHKLGDPAKACRWLAKAGQAPPEDLDCP